MERSKFSIGIHYNQVEEPLITPQSIMETLLESDEPDNVIALYMLYYYTSKYMTTNIPIATTAYVSDMLTWNPDKVRRIKKLLTDLKLIEDIIQYGNDGKIISHSIKVNLFRMEVIFDGEVENDFKKKRLTKEEDDYFFKKNPEAKEKIIEKGKERIYKKENEKVYKKEKVIPPNLEWVKEYCLERKNNVDPEAFVNFYQSKGWLVGKVRMKDWHAAIHTWERNHKDKTSQTHGKKPYIIDDGIKYKLCPDGRYRNSGGEIYFE